MSVTTVRRALLAALCIACLGVPTEALASGRHDRTEAEIIQALNGVRASHGLPRLLTNHNLARAADAHSKVMLQANRLDHGDFSRRLRRYVSSRSLGENLAWMTDCDPQTIVDMWLNSPPHRKIMLSSAFQRIGVGRRGSSECYVTADFASAT